MDATEGEELVRPLYRNGRYENPWSPWKTPSYTQLFKFMFLTKSEANIPDEKVISINRNSIENMFFVACL